MTDPLLQRHVQAQRAFFQENKAHLEKLATKQAPEALFIGCSDSRVTPEQLFDLAPGQWFMLRNVGNIVPPYWQTEIGTAAVLEFAVRTLAVPRIIVCGHTDCGAMQGLDAGVDLTRQPGLARWVDLSRPVLSEVDNHPGTYTGRDRHVALVERNVVQQLRHLESYPFIREALDADQIALHGWVYYLAEQRVGAYDPETDAFA